MEAAHWGTIDTNDFLAEQGWTPEAHRYLQSPLCDTAVGAYAPEPFSRFDLKIAKADRPTASKIVKTCRGHPECLISENSQSTRDG
jgi:hypothetical protein